VRRMWLAVWLCSALGTAGSAVAQAAPLAPAAPARGQTRTVVAGKEFDRGGTWRFWFGEGYRKA